MLDPTTVGGRGAFQQEPGRTDAALKAARAYLMSEMVRSTAMADESGKMLPEHERARIDAAVGWVTEAVIQAAMRLHPYAGAGSLHLSNPIQRPCAT